MHDNSMLLMQSFVDTYMPRRDVLDVGARAYKRQATYRELFGDRHYVGLDISNGRNVDIVVSDPYCWSPEINGATYDCVISGQCLEHSPKFWLVTHEMTRVLRKSGLMCLVAPWRGREHHCPVDCWRILPDGMRAIADWNELELLDTFMSQDDCVGVFVK